MFAINVINTRSLRATWLLENKTIVLSNFFSAFHVLHQLKIATFHLQL